jgi:hypothetical protein
MEPRALSQLCFILVLIIGLGCILAGPALDTTYPHFQLDVVLTPEELQDDALRERTLEDLKRNNRRRDWPFWLMVGAALVAVGGVGLFSTRRSESIRVR